jgi:wobble nucleotide-excising tRNase
LAVDQKTAQQELRLSDVAQFIEEIQYDNLLKEADQLEAELARCETGKSEIEKLVKKLTEEKRSLELQLQDESKGAALVNKHLTEFFGHDELKLVPDGAKPNMKFKITRENVDAKNLSEGECSLISFCYFIAKIEDELKDELTQSKLVIYIDDPISSLDSNHIFFMFSLIETIIAKPKKYAQLFISTHNLDFFKYIKRLTLPDGKNSVSYFLVERRQKKNERKSFLIKMPPHLRDYVTEFNYLFNEIYKVYKAVNGDRKQLLENSYNQFYNLPNNLRKFLECYLFYRFPNNGNPLDNLPKLFDNQIPALINRVVHEYSHLTYIDRGWMPMDVGEAEECAKLVIEKIKEKDKEQFDALVSSIS